MWAMSYLHDGVNCKVFFATVFIVLLLFLILQMCTALEYVRLIGIVFARVN